MTLARSLVVAVAQAVEREGGDVDDARDLLQVWERVNSHPLADALRREVASRRCSCADGGEANGDGPLRPLSRGGRVSAPNLTPATEDASAAKGLSE